MANITPFSVCLMNPPYMRSLHLHFLEKAIQMAQDVVSIQPATFLINQRDTKNELEAYGPLKKKLDGHVVSCEINRYNNALGIGSFVPMTIIHADMAHDTRNIDFETSSIHTAVHTIWDCNLIGSYETMHSIMRKCQSYGDMLKQHVTYREIQDTNVKYLRISRILTWKKYDSQSQVMSHRCGNYYSFLLTPCLHKYDREIYSYIPLTKNGNPSLCVYGTDTQLINWEHFVLNNKLPLFLNCILSIDQQNNSLAYVPWIVDRKYTDDEIYRMLGITADEQHFIDDTIERYKYHNEYFKGIMKLR